MTQKYTEQDVKRLVEEVSDVLAALRDGYRITSNGGFAKDLASALKPFLPDSEEELLEAMAKEHNPHWECYSPQTKEVCINDMRPVLAVVKKRGLPQ